MTHNLHQLITGWPSNQHANERYPGRISISSTRAQLKFDVSARLYSILTELEYAIGHIGSASGHHYELLINGCET